MRATQTRMSRRSSPSPKQSSKGTSRVLLARRLLLPSIHDPSRRKEDLHFQHLLVGLKPDPESASRLHGPGAKDRLLSPSVLVAAGAGAAAMALSIVAHRVAYLPIDVTVTQAVQSIHSPWLTAILQVMSTIGFPPVVDVVYGVVLVWLFAVGKRWESISATLTVLKR